MDWKLLSSKLVLDEFMKVEKRVYELPNGLKKDFYIRIGKNTAAVLALTPDHKVITAQQYRPGPAITCNELPGGIINDGESPIEGIARELWEETGYTGKFQLVTEYIAEGYTSGRRYAFVATDCRKVDEQHLDKSEDIHVELLGLPEFLTVLRSGQLTDVHVAYLGLDYLRLL